jgi:hypothetical protein
MIETIKTLLERIPPGQELLVFLIVLVSLFVLLYLVTNFVTYLVETIFENFVYLFRGSGNSDSTNTKEVKPMLTEKKDFEKSIQEFELLCSVIKKQVKDFCLIAETMTESEGYNDTEKDFMGGNSTFTAILHAVSELALRVLSLEDRTAVRFFGPAPTLFGPALAGAAITPLSSFLPKEDNNGTNPDNNGNKEKQEELASLLRTVQEQPVDSLKELRNLIQKLIDEKSK